MKNNHKLFLKSKVKNYIVTIAIGSRVLKDWEKFAKENWIKYCKNHSIGLIVIIDHLIDKKDINWKKPTWQKMLIGSYLKNQTSIKLKNICYLDTDILINPNSPNIFKFHKNKKISLISEIKVPFNLERVRKKISFFRNKYYSKRYLLDSAIFMSVRQKYEFHGLVPQKDYACAGLIMFNIQEFAEKINKWFYKYKKDTKTLTGDGDEPIFNYEIFKTKKVNLISYKFQALWFYEMADKYSFLYKFKNKKNNLIKICIEEVLSNNYFLHFPGSWYEGQMWKMKNIFTGKKKILENKKLINYFKRKLTGKPKGRVLPK